MKRETGIPTDRPNLTGAVPAHRSRRWRRGEDAGQSPHPDDRERRMEEMRAAIAREVGPLMGGFR